MALRIDLKVGVVHLSCGVEDHLVAVSGADPEGNGEVTVDRFLQSVGSQVWSLTQFYSVHLSQSRIGVKSVFSTDTQSNVVLESVLGPPGLAWQT